MNTGLPADFKIFFQGYFQVFDTIWSKIQGFFYIFQGLDAVYYKAAISWEKHENNHKYEALFLKCNSNLQIMKSSIILWNLLVLIN